MQGDTVLHSAVHKPMLPCFIRHNISPGLLRAVSDASAHMSYESEHTARHYITHLSLQRGAEHKRLQAQTCTVVRVPQRQYSPGTTQTFR